MKTRIGLSGVALAAAVTLSACGGSGDSAYCEDLSAAKDQFESFSSSSGDFAQLEDAFTTFHDLADEAPDAVAEDWATLDEGITTVEDALDEAGIELADLAEMQSGQLPEGVEMEDLQGLATEFQNLGTQEFTDASEAIEKHAKDECDVDLSATS